jgi:membrane protease YdiL (CAAX protease family)
MTAAGRQGTVSATVPTCGPATVSVAWVIVVLISAVPAIVWSELAGAPPPWLVVAQLGVLVVTLLSSLVWGALRPLRRFLIAMFVLLGLLQLPSSIDLSWLPLQALFGATVFDARMQPEQLEKLLVTAAMLLVLRLLGFRRRAFFLAVGDLRAPLRPAPLLGFPHPVPWWRFGLLWGLCIAGALAVVFLLVGPVSVGALAGIGPMLPSIVLYAGLNAFNEEMTYRAPMLATLEPVVGGGAALWQSAVVFGVAHYFGIPGGLLGAASAIFLGWILGKAMLETRGLFWSWLIHFLSDVVLFSFLAAELTR